MFDNPKRAFLEAFFLALIVFAFGIMLGVSFENNRLAEINDYYALSEISLMDSLALSGISDLSAFSCQDLIRNNIDFADRIYEEAVTLEKYEESGDLTDSLKLAHKKYDVLRTILWINVMKSRDKCPGNFSSIVYLYESEPEEVEQKAAQTVWSRILFDLKQKYGDKIILIPISVDSGISSLSSITNRLSVSRYPAVVINEKNILYDLASVDDIKRY